MKQTIKGFKSLEELEKLGFKITNKVDEREIEKFLSRRISCFALIEEMKIAIVVPYGWRIATLERKSEFILSPTLIYNEEGRRLCTCGSREPWATCSAPFGWEFCG